MTPKTIVQTPDAPQAVGPYSQAVVVGELIFISGQLPLEPETGYLADGGIGDQTAQVLENVRSVLRSVNLDLTDVVKTTIFMRDLEGFAELNEVYARYFAEFRPARSVVESSKLPKDAGVEIEAIACGVSTTEQKR